MPTVAVTVLLIVLPALTVVEPRFDPVDQAGTAFVSDTPNAILKRLITVPCVA